MGAPILIPTRNSTMDKAPNEILTLTQWLSPAFPIGAFSYSHGLEQAVEDGIVHNATTTLDWIEGLLRFGSGRNDAIFLVEAARGKSPSELDELARAYAPSAERLIETVNQGKAFSKIVSAVWDGSDEGLCYPVAFGVAVGALAFDPKLAVTLYLHAFAGSLVSAAQRLVPLGQTDAQKTLSTLGDVISEVVEDISDSTVDDLGGAIFLADIASMRHETKYSRLFQS